MRGKAWRSTREVAEARAAAENRAKRARTGGAERVALHCGSEWE